HQPSGALLSPVRGLRGDHHGLAGVGARLAHCTVSVPDLPGFGSSTSMADLEHDVNGYAAVLAQLAQELQLDSSVHLLGHSFGSIVAAMLATTCSFASLIFFISIFELALVSYQALLATLTSGF